MTADHQAATPRRSVLPMPQSLFLFWFNIALTLVVAVIGFGLGFGQELAAQLVIVYTIISAAVFLWLANAVAVMFEERFAGPRVSEDADGVIHHRPSWWRRNRVMVLSMAALLLAYLIITATVPAFRSIQNLIAFLLLELILLFAFKVAPFFPRGRSAFIGLMVLAALLVIGAFTIPGFLTAPSIRAILLFAAFLGIACIGLTMVALLGALDLSIPFVIGTANIGLMYLITLGVPPWLAAAFVLIGGGLIGLINGLLSYRLQGQALILTLGVGFAAAGLMQIVAAIGSPQAGTVMGRVPDWLRNLAAMNGTTFGLAVPPAIVIWIVLAIIVILGLRYTAYGRNLYALGGNRESARLAGISELRYWTLAYVISGFFAAMTGALLLGWSGGAHIGVGDRYLFFTLAAVVIGGTSLAGGAGGYGFTVIGVLVLQVLSTFLLGIGLRMEWQQFILGLLLVPMVALYSRLPHIRSQV